MTSGRVTVNATTVLYDQSESQVTVTIKLPQNMNVCNLTVSIRAGNSAGLSSPSEAVVMGKSQFSYLLELKLRKVETTVL